MFKSTPTKKKKNKFVLLDLKEIGGTNDGIPYSNLSSSVIIEEDFGGEGHNLFQVKTPSMVPTPPIKLTMGLVASTSRVVDTDVSSNAVSRMATLVLGSPSFSASDLMASGIDLALVFQLVPTLYERGSVTVTSVEVCEGVDVGQPVSGDVIVEQAVRSGVDSPWQAATAKIDALPT
jgi:hypothetical protein